MPRPSSNLRVFVDFKSDTVFAGEDIECTITLKNVDPGAAAPTPSAPVTPSEPNGSSRHVDPLDHLKAARIPSQTQAFFRNASAESRNPPPRRGAHYRSASSLSVVESASKDSAVESPTGGVHIADSAPDTRHTRRVSIVSLSNSPTLPQRPAPKHTRSASVQTSPIVTTPPLRSKDLSSNIATKPVRNSSRSTSPLSPSPLSGTSTPPPMRPSHARSATVQLSERWLSDQRADKDSRNDQQPDNSPSWSFQRPSWNQQDSDSAIHASNQSQDAENALRIHPNINKPPSPNTTGDSTLSRPLTSLANAFSIRNAEETPRSSVDIYSTSNNSNETLVSEYPSNPTSRLLQMPQLLRTSSQYSRQPQRPTRTTETLMMGYVQLSGSFSLDGSLVNQSPFEEVKRKAVVGGQGGGGVVGLSRSSGDGGLFGGLNWGSISESIGESFGGIMGGSNLSSIKEMKSIADSSAIPLLSTSKSILFVDLKLAPGQSRRYSYSFKLPRGLPPSHRGRAMKVTYNLVIGVQRPNNSRGQQQIKQVEVPFRVFSSVNHQGESLGHDLMSPYIILRDQAQTAALDPSTPISPGGTGTNKEVELSEDPASSASDFETYVNQLLAQSRHQSSYGLASPTAELGEPPTTPRSLSFSTPRPPQNLSARELVDQTIRYCSNPSSPQHLSTNFTIARASVPIASLTLSRSAVRLGDLITCVVDFSLAKLPCYAFEASLESSEKIDPELAIRSPQSVERATRKVWARSIENALWAKRCIFRAQVPVTATPAFTTTGVGLDWSIRLELVVGVSNAPRPANQSSTDSDDDAEEQTAQSWIAPQKSEQLLEIVAADERASVLTARQHLPCDSFEVTIPIRVFGAVADGEDRAAEESQSFNL